MFLAISGTVARVAIILYCRPIGRSWPHPVRRITKERGCRKLNLVEVIKTIRNDIYKLGKEREDKIEEIDKEYNDKIEQLKTALSVNKKMNTVCLECEGKGHVWEYSGGYEDRGSREICNKCSGTGIEQKKEDGGEKYEKRENKWD